MLELQDLIADRYLILSHLHHGYMSDVYHAYDQHLQCDVAIKLVCDDQTESRLRLHSEIQALSSLTHDHILPILDHGEYGLYHYLVMPYFKQGTLRQRISKEVFTEEEAGKILDQVSSALQVAHDHGMLHRDIKPSNILLSNEDDLYVYLADFGLAKAISAASEITQTGWLIGTPDYMAPELIDKPESVSSDIYSLGILLYHMLTGQLPFKGTTPLEILWKHMHEWPVSPSQLNPAISLPVENVILRAIHKNPNKRYPNAKALAEAYTDALQSSQQMKVPLRLPVFETRSALKSLKERDRKSLPAEVLPSVPIVRSRSHPHALHRTIMILALMAMFFIPLSLGFLVGIDKPDVSPAFSASFASALHKPAPHVTSPSPAPYIASPSPTPNVFPVKGKKVPPHVTPSVLQHRHKHPHHKNGNNSASSIDT
ncbi:MAG: serine/threonine protein kinase [Ktedonobacteraceae bacterium]